jgi:hypothetical protein
MMIEVKDNRNAIFHLYLVVNQRREGKPHEGYPSPVTMLNQWMLVPLMKQNERFR